jgi:hypothetical protein
MKTLYGILLLVGLATGARAQDASCTQILRSIRQIYTEGRLQEIPTTLDRSECFTRTEGNGGFSQQERVEAYKTLTLAYIYLEEPEKADEAMLNLLSTDHFFQTDENLDPAEFISLYKKFRTWPIFRVGGGLGIVGTIPQVIDENYVLGNANGEGKYGIKPGFTLALTFELDLFRKSPSKFLQRLVLNPDLAYTGRGLNYDNSRNFISDEGDPVSQTTGAISQKWLDLNVIVHYRLSENHPLDPYVGLGGGVNYLLSATTQGLQTSRTGQSAGVVQGPDFDIQELYNPINASVVLAAGAKYRIGAIYLTGDLQYQYGLLNVVDPSQRYSIPELVYDYGFVLDNMKQHTILFRIGVTYPYFNPIKLIR